MQAEALRHLISKLEDVQLTRAEERQKSASERVRPKHKDVRPAPRGKAADHPHQRAVHAVTVENHQR